MKKILEPSILIWLVFIYLSLYYLEIQLVSQKIDSIIRVIVFSWWFYIFIKSFSDKIEAIHNFLIISISIFIINILSLWIFQEYPNIINNPITTIVKIILWIIFWIIILNRKIWIYNLFKISLSYTLTIICIWNLLFSIFWWIWLIPEQSKKIFNECDENRCVILYHYNWKIDLAYIFTYNRNLPFILQYIDNISFHSDINLRDLAWDSYDHKNRIKFAERYIAENCNINKSLFTCNNSNISIQITK